jgi:hypothetical protein
MSELLSCPVCGGGASFGTTRHSEKSDFCKLNGLTVLHHVNCTNEKLNGCGVNNRGLFGGYKTTDEAAVAWNTRPITPLQAAEKAFIEAYRKLHDENKKGQIDAMVDAWNHLQQIEGDGNG